MTELKCCPDCDGSGLMEPNNFVQPCERCDGMGVIKIVCANCGKESDTLGSYWNGKDSKYEFLGDWCEVCAIGHISSEADYVYEQVKDLDGV